MDEFSIEFVFDYVYGFTYYVVSSDIFYALFLWFSWKIVALLCNLIGESWYRRTFACL